MKSVYYRLSLKRRMWIAFILVTVVCIAATGIYSYYFAARVMEKNALQLSQDTLNKTAQVVDERLRHIVVSASTFMMSEPFQNAMRSVLTDSESSYYTHLSALQTPFAQMKLGELSIDSVYVHTPIGDFYPTDKVLAPNREFGETAVGKAVSRAREPWSTLWIPGHPEEFFTRSRDVVSLVMRPLFDVDLPDVYIVVNVKEDTFRALIRQNMTSNRVEQLLFTRGAQPVFQAQKDAILADGGWIRDRISQQSETNVEYRGKDGREYLVNYAALGMNPEWVLVGYQSKSDLLAPMRNIRWSILMIMGGCIVLALIISSVVSDVLLRPLFKLRSLMLKVEQNHLDVRFESRYQDEVTQVGYKFNRMLEQIGALIDEVKLSEREKRKSEIKALQAQIDPHFLYNTLNTIFWKSELEEHEAVKDMIVSLSLLFRLGLNNGREVTTLGDELEHVRQYLNLQSRCYEELFDYSIEVEDPVLLELPILKIMLQPLVENSILHGFKDMTARGRIVIAVSRTGDILRIEVSDNGAGMDVREVLQRMTEPGTGRQSYALSNVGSRLTLYYGDKSSLLMNSVPYEETKITLIIPIETGGASSNGRQAG